MVGKATSIPNKIQATIIFSFILIFLSCQGEGLLATNPFEGAAGRDLLPRRRERSPKPSRFWLAVTKPAWFGAN
jgi:hypothetical protein